MIIRRIGRRPNYFHSFRHKIRRLRFPSFGLKWLISHHSTKQSIRHRKEIFQFAIPFIFQLFSGIFDTEQRQEQHEQLKRQQQEKQKTAEHMHMFILFNLVKEAVSICLLIIHVYCEPYFPRIAFSYNFSQHILNLLLHAYICILPHVSIG